jgi:hypothetical protein
VSATFSWPSCGGLCEVEVELTFYQFLILHRHHTTVFLEQASPVKKIIDK